jgi:hypothetical protein
MERIAGGLVFDELLALLKSDAVKYPVSVWRE